MGIDRRKICVVTGTRADYGILYWIIKGLNENSLVDFQLFVIGMHLEKKFGYTVETIEKDGFPITEKINIELTHDDPKGIAHSVGIATEKMAVALSKHQPDLLLLLGDRFETLAAAQAAMICRIPIAHIHGGESSEGIIDEAIRHAVTKMSHLHFVAAEPYRKRVIQLGEQPDRVFTVGAPGLDSIHQLTLLSTDQLSKELGHNLDDGYFLVTYHPVTLNDEDPTIAFNSLLSALEKFPDRKVLFTAPNADTNGQRLMDLIESYVARNPERTLFVRSLGQRRYLSAMKNALALLGNSSSGLIEAPSFGVPTVNVGDRQIGRLSAKSVIDCSEDKIAIEQAIRKALSEPFRDSLRSSESPYGTGGASQRILDKVVSFPLDGILKKCFFELDKV